MKKILIAMLFLLSIPLLANAQNGDISGTVYDTDIKAYINGVEVKSYNIGGRTAVAIEDIISEESYGYIYNDDTRTLKIWSLNPAYLIPGKNESTKKSGTAIGNTYETDIKTLIYDVVLPSYNIGGKTAVAIEDMGYNNEFSPIGGKYIWDPDKRTISLEFMYQNLPPEVFSGNDVTITVNEDLTEGEAVFEEIFHCCTGTEHFNFPDYVTDDADIETVFPIKAQGETIGYYLRRPSEEYKFTAFTYYYPEKAAEAAKNHIPLTVTKDDVIEHYETRHGGSMRERLDTDNYTFAYMSIAYTSGTADYLVQVYNDGTFVDYMDQIREPNRSVEDLKIDKENETVSFKYTDRYTPEWFTNYEIDLKSGTIEEVQE